MASVHGCCFCCFLQRIISDRDLVSAEIPGHRRSSERKNSNGIAITQLFAAVLSEWKEYRADIIARKSVSAVSS
jgi:hypothetical protein